MQVMEDGLHFQTCPAYTPCDIPAGGTELQHPGALEVLLCSRAMLVYNKAFSGWTLGKAASPKEQCCAGTAAQE